MMGKKESSGTGREKRRKEGAESSRRAAVERQLREACKQIDVDGLLFLLHQAHILIHNVQVDKLNRELAELGEREKAVTGRLGSRQALVFIEESDNRKTFFLTLNRVRKALTLEELQRIVRICYAAQTKSAALGQLFKVFAKERGDILADAGIGSPRSPLLEALFTAVRDKYRLQDR